MSSFSNEIKNYNDNCPPSNYNSVNLYAQSSKGIMNSLLSKEISMSQKSIKTKGSTNTTITTRINKVKWFYGGFCLFCWIRLTESDIKDNLIKNLVEMEVKSYGKISLNFKGNSLLYTIDFTNLQNQNESKNTNSSTISLKIATIPWNTWCFIGFNHQRKLYHKSI